MRPTVYLIAGLFACLALSCKKDKVKVDQEGLTGCPTNATCENMFTEQADLSAAEKLTAGNFRVFWARKQYSGITSTLYVKAPMAGNGFTLTSDDIRAGKAFVSSSCVSCLMAAYTTVDGEVKGVNTTPGIQADKSKWLVEAKIIRAAVGYPNMRDTVYVKQYFYPNFVYN